MPQKGEKMLFRPDRMAEIAKSLPDGRFNARVLEKAIGLGRQSVGGYVSDMLRYGWIKESGDMFVLTDAAKNAGRIVVMVTPAVRVPEVRRKISEVIEGLEYAAVEEV